MATTTTRPTRRRTALSAPDGQGVSFAELFFDLVFVFAVTNVTGLLAHDLTWVGLAQSALVFWLIWWAWTQYSWALNPTNTGQSVVRATIMVATGTAFIMATGVHDAFGDGGLWFAVPYVCVRLIGLSLYWRVSAEGTVARADVRTFATLSSFGMAAVITGGLVDTPLRYWLWVAAIGFDLLAGFIAGRKPGWNLNADRFVERHALFVIIVLGESLIATGTTAVELERTADLTVVAIGAVLFTGLLWWTYFNWFNDAMKKRLEAMEPAACGGVASEAFSFMHFPLVGGVIGVAVASEEMVAHPNEHLPTAGFVALVVGITLFVGATAASWCRATGIVLVPRVTLLAATIAVLTMARDAEPEWLLLIATVGLGAIALTERVPPAEVEVEVEAEAERA